MLYLSSLLAVTVALLIRAEILGLKPQIYLLKPVSTLLVIGVAALSLTQPVYNVSYSYWILLGLGLCFGGDLALMFQGRPKAFMVGLVLFLLGHVAYTVAFTLLGVPSSFTMLAGLMLMVAGLSFYRLIHAGLGSVRTAVILYLLVISLMVMQATTLLDSAQFNRTQALMVIGGAFLFYVSDVMLAANRFWRPWKYNRTSLAFYYTGQLLIALAASGFE